MIALNRILVATDYSESSRDAYAVALSMAGRLGARVDLVHVWSAPFFGAEYDALAADKTHHSLFALVREQAEKDMVAFAASAPVPEGVEVVRHVHSGEPIKVVTDVARELAADLIVAGTHGRTGAKYLLLGSIATKLVRHAPCPVLTVPPKK